MAKEIISLDCLIVLGARLNPEGRPGRIARMRLLHALEVWRAQGAGAFLLITGGPSHPAGVTEARAMADFALGWVADNWGPRDRERLAASLVLEEVSLSTQDSAENTLPLILRLEVQTLGLVSDTLHLKRARRLFRRHFRPHPLIIHKVPVPGVIRHYWQNRRYLWLTKMVLRETGAWLKLLARRTLPGRRPKIQK